MLLVGLAELAVMFAYTIVGCRIVLAEIIPPLDRRDWLSYWNLVGEVVVIFFWPVVVPAWLTYRWARRMAGEH